MFDTEIQGLRKLIANAQGYCNRHGYDSSAADVFIDQRCRRYLDIVIPLVAAKPEIYDLLVKERPSLGPYIKEQVNQHMASAPSVQEVETQLVTILDDMKKRGFTKTGSFDIGDVASVQILLNRYGFAQELLYAIRKVRPELFNVVLNLYDMRLNAAQTVDEPVHDARDR
ncbi:MAG: hypothetical protein ACM3ZQ_09125 [Bacillota bacterium]